MSTIKVKGNECHTHGQLPAVGETAPDFALCRTDLSVVTLADFAGKPMLINIYPSIDTSVCFESVKQFNKAVSESKGMIVACVSMDLPFALQRIAAGESFEDVLLLSDFRNRDFGDLYGLTIADGPLAGLLARAVIVLDSAHKVVYYELVKDVGNPPNYEAALAAVKKHIE